jgi:hypothetical protein
MRKKRLKQLLDDLKKKGGVPEIERGNIRLHVLENSLWQCLWTCRKTDYTMKL